MTLENAARLVARRTGLKKSHARACILVHVEEENLSVDAAAKKVIEFFRHTCVPVPGTHCPHAPVYDVGWKDGPERTQLYQAACPFHLEAAVRMALERCGRDPVTVQVSRYAPV